MPHTISTLISSKNLSESDVKATLEACQLSLDVSEYCDEDIRDKFDVIREMFAKGEVSDYQSAKALFQSITTVKSAKNRPVKPVEPNKGRKNPKNQSLNSTPVNTNDNVSSDNSNHQVDANNGTSAKEKTLSISDLINRVKQHLDLTLTLKQVLVILETSNLPDKEYYTQAEANRFLVACSLITGGENTDIASKIQDVTVALETGLIDLVDAVTQERAKEIPELVKQLYLQNVVMSLTQNQENIESFFMQLKDSIVAGIEGKSPLKSIMETEWTQPPLPKSPHTHKSLPVILESTASEELKSE